MKRASGRWRRRFWSFSNLVGLVGLLLSFSTSQAQTPNGSEFQVNTYTPNAQRYPTVAMDGSGNFVVVWQSSGSSGPDTSNYSIQGQRYDSAGQAVGSQFQVNTYTTGSQRFPTVATDGSGDFVVVWQSLGSSGADTSGLSIQGQRYGGPLPVELLHFGVR